MRDWNFRREDVYIKEIKENKKCSRARSQRNYINLMTY